MILHRVAMLLHEALITSCSLVALLCPVLLWTAWSPAAFLAVLEVSTTAILALYLLIALSPDGDH